MKTSRRSSDPQEPRLDPSRAKREELPTAHVDVARGALCIQSVEQALTAGKFTIPETIVALSTILETLRDRGHGYPICVDGDNPCY